MTEQRTVYLSVDWDFFFPEDASWDFGHCEGWAPELEDALWHSRAAGMLSMGKDLRALTAAHTSVAPAQFWRELQSLGYDFTGARVGIAESHKAAASFFLGSALRLGARIVHIDAHHDLGYCTREAMSKSVKKAVVDAGNWLGVLLHLFPHLRADIVWPQWKCDVDDEFAGAPLTKLVRSHVTSQAWPAPSLGPVKVARVFICRSGAWVPPWHDDAFKVFVAEAEDRAGCKAEVVELLRERRFLLEAVEKEATVLRSMRGQLKGKLDNATSG